MLSNIIHNISKIGNTNIAYYILNLINLISVNFTQVVKFTEIEFEYSMLQVSNGRKITNHRLYNVLSIWWYKLTQISFYLCYLLNAKKDRTVFVSACVKGKAPNIWRCH